MSWKIIWKSLKSGDMRKRIFAVLGMLVVFRILAHVPIPLEDPETLKQILDNLFTTDSPQLLSFLNTISGGALANFSIMIVGLGPYINASIIMQLLTKAIPKLESLNEDGEFGRRKINQYTRILTFPLAIIQSIGAIYLVRQAAGQVGGISADITAVGMDQWILMITALTGGAMLLMWLGELITEQGIGNGISLLITIGIVSQLPTTLESIFGAVFDPNGNVSWFGGKIVFESGQMIFALVLLVATLLITIAIVKLNEAARRLTVNYAKRVQGNRAYGGVTTVLPVKLITAGVIPIIFAVAFLSVPSFAGQLLSGSGSARMQALGQSSSRIFQNPTPEYFQQISTPVETQYLNFGTQEIQGQVIPAFSLEPIIYPLTYFLLVFLFTFFYTGITFDAKQISENLQKQGGFLEGVRSGKKTEEYLKKVVGRLTLFGATALGFIALVPIIGQVFLSSNIALGGTSILILVAVALETLRSVESRALMVTYDQYEQPDFFYDLEPKDRTEVVTRKSRLNKLLKRKKK